MSRIEAQWNRVEQQVAAAQPGLRLVRESGQPACIEGKIEVILPTGRTEEHEITIKYLGDNPFDLPHTYDHVGRFIRNADNHVEADGRFCMWLPQTGPVSQFQQPDGVLVYLGFVQEFIGLQLMYEVRRKHGVKPHWPGPEWQHGARGHEQWFRETAPNLTAVQLKTLLDAAARTGRPGSRCPCGSGKQLGKCHGSWLRKLRRAVSADPTVLATGYHVARSRI